MDFSDHNPWEILELDSENATDRDVKRAYARLIKVHRPDSDPEGFQRVREAYELALRLIAVRDHEREEFNGEDDAIVPEPIMALSEAAPQAAEVSIPPLPPDLPINYLIAETRLKDALLTGASQSDIPPALHEFIHIGIKHPECRERLGPALERHFHEQLPILANAVDANDVLLLIFNDITDIPQSIGSQWSLSGQHDRLVAMARAMIEAAAHIHTPNEAACYARYAELLAFANSHIAKKLANIAYPHLPSGLREWIMQRVDHRLAVGGMFQGLNRHLSQFWEQRLFNSSEESATWDDPESRAAIRTLLQARLADWPGHAVLAQVVPPHVLNSFPPPAMAPAAPKRSILRFWWVLLIGLIFAAGIFSDKPPKQKVESPKGTVIQPSLDRIQAVKRERENALQRELDALAALPSSSPEERRRAVQIITERDIAVAGSWERFKEVRDEKEQMRRLGVSGAKLEHRFALLLCALYDDSIPLAVKDNAVKRLLGDRFFRAAVPALASAHGMDSTLANHVRESFVDYVVGAKAPLPDDLRRDLARILPIIPVLDRPFDLNAPVESDARWPRDTSPLRDYPLKIRFQKLSGAFPPEMPPLWSSAFDDVHLGL